jgi:hypothetical protein
MAVAENENAQAYLTAFSTSDTAYRCILIYADKIQQSALVSPQLYAPSNAVRAATIGSASHLYRHAALPRIPSFVECIKLLLA